MGDLQGKIGAGLRRWTIAALGVVWVGAVVGKVLQAQPPAGSTMLVEPPAPLLPAMLGKINRVAEGDSGDGLGSVDAADAQVLKEDGLRRFARSEYVPETK